MQYFVIKRALAPIAVAARRYTVKEYRDRFSVVDVVEIACVDVWASSSGLSGEKVVVRLAAYEILTGKRVHQEEWTTELEANRSTELKKLEIPLAWNDNKEAVVVHASLHTTKSGSMLSSVAVWPEPCLPFLQLRLLLLITKPLQVQVPHLPQTEGRQARR